MAQQPEVVGQIPAQAEAENKPAPVAQDKPIRVLPTERISFTKQQEILRAFAVGAAGGKSVSNSDLANLTKLNISTASYNNAFYIEAGLIIKGGNGFTPSPEVTSFNRAYAFDPEKAGYKLAPVLKATWFGELVLRQLAMRPAPENDTLTELGIAAQANVKYRGNLKLLIDYLEFAGLVERDGGTLKVGPMARDTSERSAPEPQKEKPAAEVVHKKPPQVEPPAGAGVSTGFTHVPEGTMRIFVDMSVDLKEMAGWKPEVVAAFFGGIAQVLSAKAMVERERTR